jgi:hypothetical protein
MGNIPVMPLVHALVRQPELWDTHTGRTRLVVGSPHHAVSDIWLRFNDVAKWQASEYSEIQSKEAALSELDVVDYSPFRTLPLVRGIVFDLARLVESDRIGRVLITKLPPGASIDPHEDGGEYAKYYERYQIALQSEPGTVFSAGGESVFMATGDCWWFDNTVEHKVVNNSATDRISLIVDLHCMRGNALG